jgi:hypothetical protein
MRSLGSWPCREAASTSSVARVWLALSPARSQQKGPRHLGMPGPMTALGGARSGGVSLAAHDTLTAL